MRFESLVVNDTTQNLFEQYNYAARKLNEQYTGQIFLSDYNPNADGIVDDYQYFEQAYTDCPEGGVIILGTANYKLSRTIEINKRVTFQGIGTTITLDQNVPGFYLQFVEACEIRGIRFIGSGRGTATRRNQTAISMYKGNQHLVYDCSFTGVSGAAILATGTEGIVDTRLLGNKFYQLYFDNNNIGIQYSGRSEYNNAVGIVARENNKAITDDSGNNNLTGFTWHFNYVGYEVTAGSNNAHGQITGGNINHHYTYGISITSAATGMLITGVSFFDAPFLVHNSQLVIFRSCLIDTSGGQFTGTTASSGLDGCSFYSGAVDPRTVITGTGYFVRNLVAPNNRTYNWNYDYSLEGGSFIAEGSIFTNGFKIRKSFTEPYVQRYYVPLFTNILSSSGQQDSNIFLTGVIQNVNLTVTLHIQGLKADGTIGYSAIKIASFRRTGATTAVLTGAITTVHEIKENAGLETTGMNINGAAPNDLLRVTYATGDATIYNWTAFAEITMNKA
jgi:hypothetical protein